MKLVKIYLNLLNKFTITTGTNFLALFLFFPQIFSLLDFWLLTVKFNW